MSAEPSLQARHDTLNIRSGYGGITEKISRLNDILSNLEARRSRNRYDSPDVSSCPPIWPPTLHNSSKLFKTRAALESPHPPDGVLNTLPATLPTHSTESALLDTSTRHHHASIGMVDMPPRKHRRSRGGSVFDTLGPHHHLRRTCMPHIISQKHHAEGHGILDTLARHPHAELSDFGILDTLTRHHARESGVLETFMRGRHSSGDDVVPDTLPSHHVKEGGMLNILSHLHATSTPRSSNLHSEIDFYTPNYHPPLLRVSPAQRNHNIHELTHNSYHNYEPFQPNYFFASGDHHPFEKPKAPSNEFPSHNKECTKSSLNVSKMAHEILARLERLEVQQTTSKRLKLQRPSSKKRSVQKVGGDKKISKQEKSLLQAVRRRAKNVTLSACERKASPRTRKNWVKEIAKHVQRLESELELCWSAINQLCIDNEQFREEQRCLIQRIGPLHQWSSTRKHATSSYNNTNKPKKRGERSTYSDDFLMQTNDSSG